MKPTLNQLKNELKFIELNYDLSPDYTPEIRDYLLENHLIDWDPETDLIFLTCEGELLIGVDKQDLRDRYSDDDEEYESSNTENDDAEENDDDYDF